MDVNTLTLGDTTHHEALDETDSSHYFLFFGSKYLLNIQISTPPLRSKYSTTVLTRDAQISVPRFLKYICAPLVPDEVAIIWVITQRSLVHL